MGHITCVRGAGSPVVYIICDPLGKCKGFIKNSEISLLVKKRDCILAKEYTISFLCAKIVENRGNADAFIWRYAFLAFGVFV